MSNFIAIYARRSRQIVIIAIMGAFALVATVMLSLGLPWYHGLTAATDGRTVFLAAQLFLPPPDNTVFVTTRSADGAAFGKPVLRSGLVRGIAAQDGRLHALFADGSLLTLGAKPDDWRTLRPQLAWTPTGIAMVDNELIAFGQSADRRGTVLAAVLDNVTWRPWGEFAGAGDNIVHFLGTRSRGEDYVLWVGLVAPAEPADERMSPEEMEMLPWRVGIGRASVARPESGRRDPLRRREVRSGREVRARPADRVHGGRRQRGRPVVLQSRHVVLPVDGIPAGSDGSRDDVRRRGVDRAARGGDGRHVVAAVGRPRGRVDRRADIPVYLRLRARPALHGHVGDGAARREPLGKVPRDGADAGRPVEHDPVCRAGDGCGVHRGGRDRGVCHVKTARAGCAGDRALRGRDGPLHGGDARPRRWSTRR